MASSVLTGLVVGGSYICEEYELRVTSRCLHEDLDSATDDPFGDLGGHEIMRAFVNRRSAQPYDTKEVAPLTCGVAVWRLAYGNRHRGATWFDEANRVVWLLAYGRHESGSELDAFPHFKDLDADDRLLPDDGDYYALFRDRDERILDVVELEAAELLAAARQAPLREQRAVLGGQFGVGVAVEVVETLEEVYVAVKIAGLTEEILAIVLAAFFPDCDQSDIESTGEMPTRVLDKDELGFRCLLG
jgi:hypothetical protein